MKPMLLVENTAYELQRTNPTTRLTPTPDFMGNIYFGPGEKLVLA